MPRIELHGCQREPLGSYLKALAVLRLVSTQVDREARGWWGWSCFCLQSSLNEEDLAGFFLNAYQPSPVVAPWNGGSGFYPKDRKVGIQGILNSGSARFAEYRKTIEIIQSFPEVSRSEKGTKKSDKDTRRAGIQRGCRNLLPDSAVDWLDAVVAITGEDKRAFPPILGTGGNEGRLDYTNNFMENLVKLLIAPDQGKPIRELLRNALFGTPAAGFEPAAVGQYDPGRAGGFNQGQEVETKDIPSNPWNFVLTIEGAVGWASGVHRRQGTAYSRAFLCSPFTAFPCGVGYTSAAAKDDSLARAEIWAPIWGTPATYGEIEALLREGRAQVGGRPAENGLQFAQAATSLGVDRGVEGFMRFSLLRRRGDSYVALPAGYFGVEYRAKSDLVEQMNPLLERVDRFILGFKENPPASLTAIRRQLDDAIYGFLLRGGQPEFNRMAAALGRLRRCMLLRPKDSRVILPQVLTEGWISACGLSPEVRIAAGVGLIRNQVAEDRNKVRDIRFNLTRGDSGFAWVGVNLAQRMARVLGRRVLDAEREGSHASALYSPLEAHPADISLFLQGQLDEELIEDLLFAFTLVKAWGRQGSWKEDWNKGEPEPLESRYVLLRRLFDPDAKASDGKPMRGEPRVLPLLQAGRIQEACRVAQWRIAVSDAKYTPIWVEYSDHGDGIRLAAALLIPVQRCYQDIGQRRCLWDGVLTQREGQ